MSCWVIIPVKEPDEGKQRLAGVLDAPQRKALVGKMLERVVAAAQQARGIGRIAVVGSSRHGLHDSLALLPDPGTGLNPALASAFEAAKRGGATRVLFLFADLPQLTALDVELLLAAPEIAIAPDRHGRGTNALCLPLPAAQDFAFAFGTDSFARHKGEAERLGLGLEEVRSPGLAHDIDEPSDLADIAGLLGD